ncbi:hypothetical protein CSOJ01_06675 [Colletotrichum sojae]|uniref:Uncharacterized protein n=1 Tax=Colletotrichum sojae TaxID=2175907 RepID=A0A8H6JB28_9PEZI|nr:hypothetical protein CSOJ01_06675 [Colletotrichum sojae]
MPEDPKKAKHATHQTIPRAGSQRPLSPIKRHGLRRQEKRGGSQIASKSSQSRGPGPSTLRHQFLCVCGIRDSYLILLMLITPEEQASSDPVSLSYSGLEGADSFGSTDARSARDLAGSSLLPRARAISDDV